MSRKKRTPRQKERDEAVRCQAAYHECGHALYAHCSPHFDAVTKVTIRRTRRTLGQTFDEHSDAPQSRAVLIDNIASYCAGRVAEELAEYDPDDGARSDLTMATAIAKTMVMQYGMGQRVGTRVIGFKEHVGDKLQGDIDQDIRDILDEADRLAQNVLGEHLGELHALAEVLLERETIGPKELENILGPKA